MVKEEGTRSATKIGKEYSKSVSGAGLTRTSKNRGVGHAEKTASFFSSEARVRSRWGSTGSSASNISTRRTRSTTGSTSDAKYLASNKKTEVIPNALSHAVSKGTDEQDEQELVNFTKVAPFEQGHVSSALTAPKVNKSIQSIHQANPEIPEAPATPAIQKSLAASTGLIPHASYLSLKSTYRGSNQEGNPSKLRRIEIGPEDLDKTVMPSEQDSDLDHTALGEVPSSSRLESVVSVESEISPPSRPLSPTESISSVASRISTSSSNSVNNFRRLIRGGQLTVEKIQKAALNLENVTMEDLKKLLFTAVRSCKETPSLLSEVFGALKAHNIDQNVTDKESRNIAMYMAHNKYSARYITECLRTFSSVNLSHTDSKGNNLMHYLSSFGLTECQKIVTEFQCLQVILNNKNNNKYTPIDLINIRCSELFGFALKADWSRLKEEVVASSESGALGSLNWDKHTIFHVAFEHNHMEICVAILKRLVELDVQDLSGYCEINTLPEFYKYADSDGQNLLHHLAYASTNDEFIKICSLLPSGYVRELCGKVDKRNETPINIIDRSESGVIGMLKHLSNETEVALQQLRTKNFIDNTAFDAAFEDKRFDICVLILKKLVELSVQDLMGYCNVDRFKDYYKGVDGNENNLAHHIARDCRGNAEEFRSLCELLPEACREELLSKQNTDRKTPAYVFNESIPGALGLAFQKRWKEIGSVPVDELSQKNLDGNTLFDLALKNEQFNVCLVIRGWLVGQNDLELSKYYNQDNLNKFCQTYQVAVNNTYSRPTPTVGGRIVLTQPKSWDCCIQ